MELKEIEINKIKPNPLQPRERFDTEKLNQLANSIKQVGSVQPIIVEETKPQRFIIISGERRWKAHSKAKLNKVLSLVKKYDKDLQKKKELLAANLNRENLADFEEWKYVYDVAKSEGWIHNGKNPRYEKEEMNVPLVSQFLGIDSGRLNDLQNTFRKTTTKLKKAVREGKMSLSAAGRYASKLSKEEQDKLAEEALASEERIRRSEIISKVKEIKAEKIKEEYGVGSFELERTEQDIVNEYLTKLSELDEVHFKMKKKGFEVFENSSLRRIATSMVVKFSNLIDFYDYGIKPDKRFLKLVKYGKEISKKS